MNKTLTIGISAILLLVIAFTLGGGRIVVKETVERLGALAGPDIPSAYLKWGGVEHYGGSMALNTATTTPCAIQAPSATSTLRHASLTITTASSTATTWTVAKATTAFATTTPFTTNFSLGSGAQGTMVATSTTVIAVDEVSVIGPNQWVVWGVAGIGNLTSDKLLGVCKAEFVVTGR